MLKIWKALKRLISDQCKRAKAVRAHVLARSSYIGFTLYTIFKRDKHPPSCDYFPRPVVQSCKLKHRHDIQREQERLNYLNACSIAQGNRSGNIICGYKDCSHLGSRLSAPS
ncbi:unnamed protein product [Arabis nemorensis]|uniref:Uncharacterized protein n=1 Tax=Arabis nemorensis TaxID=586526 RepID=A0A565BI31_9BRAS|nr:unnamed protein product [Arabis nemorensis]